jgi:molybdopterin-guanine dinucleotide biosynthesis protein A
MTGDMSSREQRSGLGVLILVGGSSRRMGADKAELLWSGRRAVDILAELAAVMGADLVKTVGPHAYGLPAITDEATGGGPVAGIASGLKGLAEAGCNRALVLAVDAPTIQLSDLAPLLATPAPGGAYEGLNLPFVINLAPTPPAGVVGWPVARFIETAGLARLPAPEGALARLRGANTPTERRRLMEELAFRGGAKEPGAG